MNKEKIRKAKKHYILTTEHELDDNNKRLKEYIEYLEQKESILDKVTDKLKEDIEKYNKELMKDSIMSIKNTDLTARILQSQKILNIIEGEKK